MRVESKFKPAWWLRNPHLQTLWAGLVRRRPRVSRRRERLELPDGDFIDLDWNDGGAGPIVIVFHGLEGGIESRYAAGIMAAIAAQGWRGVLMHFRGCGGELNRLPRSYHSGDTGDMRHFIRTLRGREPDVPFAAIGYSLGGNALLKYLGEEGANAGLAAAAAVSVPFDLARCAERLSRGLSRFYQRKLVGSLRRKTEDKFRTMSSPIPLDDLPRWRDFRQFDNFVTAPLHGLRDVDHYYSTCSSRQFLRHIAIPTLILHAEDDPFMTPAVIPAAGELAPAVRLELSRYGGHVGFVCGGAPWRARYWLEQRIPRFLQSHLLSPA